MRLRFLVLVLFAFDARATAQCPPVSFLPVQSATLTPSPGVHRALVKQSDGTYTAFEISDLPPHSLIRKIPNFQKQLSPCQPATTGLPPLDALAVAQTPEGGYIITFRSPSGATGADVAVFDLQFNLIAEAPTELYPLAFADVNGDGKLDLIGRTFDGPDLSTQTIIVALGTGGANFQGHSAWQVVFSGAAIFTGCVVADVNGDHKPDIIVTSQLPSNVVLFLGNGDGTFRSGTTIAPSNSPGEVIIADLNGDGKPDLIFSDATVQIAIGHGDGTFGAPTPYAVAGTGITVADVNGDGIPDIVTNGVTILFGDGKGGFGNRRDFLVEAEGDPIVTDFDSDGIPDILIGFNGDGYSNIGSGLGNPSFILGDRITVLFGLGNGKFAGPPVGLNSLGLIATADVNGDGIPDLVSGDLAGHVDVLLGVGDGTFRGSSNPSSAFVESLVVADFNHDGKIDLAVAGDLYNSSSGVGQVDIYLGNGDGTFQRPIQIATPVGTLAMATGDFNKDANPDLAVIVSQGEGGATDSVLILLGKGDGTFTAGATYAVGPSASSVLVGDFNNDGNLDVVVGDSGTTSKNMTDGNIAFLAGKGDGTFSAPVLVPVTITSPAGVNNMIAGDFNRDGKLDLALALSNPGSGLAILLGRGDGSFQPPAYYAVDTGSVYAGDLNGDGLPDLIVSSEFNISSYFLLGNGDGSFRPPVQFCTYCGGLALADFDEDGKLDIAAISSDGVATFLNTSTPPPGIAAVSAASNIPGPIAPESIAAIYGTNLPAKATSVSITDITGATFPGSVLYASSSQVNFVAPEGVDGGTASVHVGGQSASVLIDPVAPALFSLNANGLAAAYVTRVSGDSAVNEPVATHKDGAFTPVPIDVATGQAYLILFGTGFRNSKSITMTSTIELPNVTYFGPQSSFAGLDQINLPLPSTIAGFGCLNLQITSEPYSGEPLTSNAVYVCIK